jgi:peptidoglycan glycosyltransferase
VASGGNGVKPYVVSAITDGSEAVYTGRGVETGRIMSTQTAEILQSFLRNNVQNYYGEDAFPGLTVCAKSGTAEVGGDKRPNAMFTGFVADPEYPLAFLVAIEDGGYGRPVCVPILSQILQACKLEMDGQFGIR